MVILLLYKWQLAEHVRGTANSGWRHQRRFLKESKSKMKRKKRAGTTYTRGGKNISDKGNCMYNILKVGESVLYSRWKKKNALCPEVWTGRWKSEQVYNMQAEEVLARGMETIELPSSGQRPDQICIFKRSLWLQHWVCYEALRTRNRTAVTGL